MDIRWSTSDDAGNEDDGTHDLCGTFLGKYVDVVRSDVDQTWSWFFDGERHESGIQTRDAAKQRLVEYTLTFTSDSSQPLET